MPTRKAVGMAPARVFAIDTDPAAEKRLGMDFARFIIDLLRRDDRRGLQDGLH